MGPFELPPEAVGNLEGLAESLSLPEYDLLLVGDGTGNAYTQRAGWACVAGDRLKGRATVHAGGPREKADWPVGRAAQLNPGHQTKQAAWPGGEHVPEAQEETPGA
jgi:hypothetical protein